MSHFTDPNPELALLGWEPTPFLRAFYAMTPVSDETRIGLPWRLLPWHAVTPLTAHVRFGEENICWDPADAILLCTDGLGGGWTLVDQANPVWRRFLPDHSLLPAVSRRTAVFDILSHRLQSPHGEGLEGVPPE